MNGGSKPLQFFQRHIDIGHPSHFMSAQLKNRSLDDLNKVVTLYVHAATRRKRRYVKPRGQTTLDPFIKKEHEEEKIKVKEEKVEEVKPIEEVIDYEEGWDDLDWWWYELFYPDSIFFDDFMI